MKELVQFIIGQLRPYRKTVLFCTALAILAAVLDTVAPIILGRGFDVAGRRAPLIAFGGILVAWFIIRTTGERVRTYIASRGEVIAQKAGNDFTSRTLIEFLHKPLAFHHDMQRGSISEALSKFSGDLTSLIGGVVFDLVPAALALVAILGYVAYLDWKIALALLLSIVWFLGYTYALTPLVVAVQRKRNEASRKVFSYGWDALYAALVVKSTSNEKLIERTLEGHNQEFEAALGDIKALDRRVMDAQNLIIAVGSLLAVFLAVMNFNRGQFTFGQVTVIVAYCFSIYGYVRYALWQFRTLVKSLASYRAVQELREVADEDYGGGKAVDISGGITFKNVRFRYREDRPILEDINFGVKAGQRVAIVGESGEGKTTLVDLLGRYYEPQAGAILFDGHESKEVNLIALRSQMAYVPQDLTLFHESLGYNIRFGRPDATDDEVRLAAKRAHLEDFIAALPEGLATVVGERGLKLSGGERQRVALARAFLRNPKILVLDEPTAHLDSRTEASIQAALDELMRGRTTFIIAHRLRTVAGADLILVLNDGRIAEQGTHAELVAKNGAYAALLKAQGGFLTPNEEHLN